MAGFDFTFEYENAALELVRRLLHHSQRRALYFDLEFHYRINREHQEYVVIVDGRLRSMQALGARLWIEVPLLAEWHPRPKPAWRRTDAGFWFLEGYAEGLRDITAHVRYLPKVLKRMVVPELADDWYAPESIVFDPDLMPSHLVVPLRTFQAVLALYLNLPENAAGLWPPVNQIEVELVVEECHTATELLLRNALQPKAGQSYAQMVDDAHRRRWLNRGQRDYLISLKELRKRVKHYGQGAPRFSSELLPMVMNAAACSHLLLERIAGRTMKHANA